MYLWSFAQRNMAWRMWSGSVTRDHLKDWVERCIENDLAGRIDPSFSSLYGCFVK
jgi:hypothetical protein